MNTIDDKLNYLVENGGGSILGIFKFCDGGHLSLYNGSNNVVKKFNVETGKKYIFSFCVCRYGQTTEPRFVSFTGGDYTVYFNHGINNGVFSMIISFEATENEVTLTTTSVNNYSFEGAYSLLEIL